MKLCSKCKIEKPFTDFSPNKGKKNNLQSRCKICMNTTMKELYKKDPAKRKRILSKTLSKIIAIVDEIKFKSGCKFCAEKEPICLDFHHINPEEKDENVSTWVRGKNIKKALEEMKKCIIVCSNCHRKIHKNLIKV